MTNKPVDDFTADVERQVWAVKNDKKAREEYMVLQAELRDTQILAFEAGEAQGHAAGLAEGEAKGREAGLAEGEVNKFVAMVERKMKRKNMTCEEAMDDLDSTPEERQAYYDYLAKHQQESIAPVMTALRCIIHWGAVFVCGTASKALLAIFLR